MINFRTEDRIDRPLYAKAIELIVKGLTKQELVDLHLQLDGDAHNDFYWQLAEAVSIIAPEEFVSENDDERVELPSNE